VSICETLDLDAARLRSHVAHLLHAARRRGSASLVAMPLPPPETAPQPQRRSA
jgi:hypothetical protein